MPRLRFERRCVRKMPGVRRALAPTGAVDPATLTRAERIQWDGYQMREALNRQIIDLAGQGLPIRAMARTTGVSRQTVRICVITAAMPYSVRARPDAPGCRLYHCRLHSALPEGSDLDLMWSTAAYSNTYSTTDLRGYGEAICGYGIASSCFLATPSMSN